MTPPAMLHPFCTTTREDHEVIVSGRGCTLTTRSGRQLLDAMAGLWYAQVGWGRPELIRAMSEQAERLAVYHCFEPFANEPAERLAVELADIAPTGGCRVFFGTSGSDAVDTALKLARLTHRLSGEPSRTVVLTREHAYHGTNLGGTSLQGIAANREGWGPLVPEVVTVPADDLESTAATMSELGDRLAAVICEPVQGAGGVRPPPDGYLEGLRRLCDRHGALLIVDEVICGFGRLGDWFASRRWGVRPDLVTFAKGVTSGYVPLSGVLVGPRVREALESDRSLVLRHGYTYSGHPTACAVGLANLAVIAQEGLLERADRIGERLGAGLDALAGDGLVGAVRGAGAVFGVEVPPSRDAATVRQRMLDEGVIVRALGSTIALCPPLVMTDAEVDRVVDTLASALR